MTKEQKEALEGINWEVLQGVCLANMHQLEEELANPPKKYPDNMFFFEDISKGALEETEKLYDAITAFAKAFGYEKEWTTVYQKTREYGLTVLLFGIVLADLAPGPPGKKNKKNTKVIPDSDDTLYRQTNKRY